MKRLLPLVLLVVVAAEPQNAPMESLCIALSQESSSSTNASAKDPLEAAVMTSGDFDFYPSRHDGCWTVHVLSLPTNNAKGKAMGMPFRTPSPI
jgi:hypothetical protein